MAGSGRDRRRGTRRVAGRAEESGRSDVPREIGQVLREAMDTARFQRGLALGRLARSWDDVVGPRLAQETAPASLDDGGLVVAVSTGAWGAQVRFLTDEIRLRANEVLGSEEVRAVRVVVGRSERRG